MPLYYADLYWPSPPLLVRVLSHTRTSCPVAGPLSTRVGAAADGDDEEEDNGDDFGAAAAPAPKTHAGW